MIIKTYTAPDVDKIEKMISEDMGDRAVILTSKKIRHKGLKSLFLRNRVEVVAAIDEEHYRARHQGPQTAIAPVEKEWNNAVDGLNVLKRAMTIPALIKDYHGQDAVSMPQIHFPPTLRKLRACGISFSLAADIMFEIGEEASTEALIEALASYLPVIKPLSRKGTGPLYAGFIGPREVGKTSLIFKIAAQHVQQKNQQVAIISPHAHPEEVTYLEELAHSCGITFCYSLDQFNQAASIHPFDVVLFDLNEESDAGKQLPLKQPCSLHLVLSAYDNHMMELLERYRQTPLTSLNFTKLDCSFAIGNIVNQVNMFQLPIGYLSTGPKIPADLIYADPKKLAEQILASAHAAVSAG